MELLVLIQVMLVMLLLRPMLGMMLELLVLIKLRMLDVY